MPVLIDPEWIARYEWDEVRRVLSGVDVSQLEPTLCSFFNILEPLAGTFDQDKVITVAVLCAGTYGETVQMHAVRWLIDKPTVQRLEVAATFFCGAWVHCARSAARLPPADISANHTSPTVQLAIEALLDVGERHPGARLNLYVSALTTALHTFPGAVLIERLVRAIEVERDQPVDADDNYGEFVRKIATIGLDNWQRKVRESEALRHTADSAVPAGRLWSCGRQFLHWARSWR